MLAALIFSMDHSLALLQNHGDYSPFAVSQNVSTVALDETNYAALAVHLAALHRYAPETDVYEQRHLHANVPLIPTAILAALATVSGNIERAFILSDVLFPPLLLLLFYLLSAGLVENRYHRMMIAWGTMAIPFAPQDFTWLGYDHWVNPPIVTRTPQPEISLVFLLIAILLLARSLTVPSRLVHAFAGGFAAGLLIYCYYFYFIGAFFALGILFALGLAWRNRLLARSVFVAGAGALFAAVPYLAILLMSRGEGGQGYMLGRIVTHTRHLYAAPFLQGVLLLAAIAVFGRRASVKNTAHMRFLVTAVLVTAGLLVSNNHVLTGTDVQNAHFLHRLANPLFFFLLCVTAFHYLGRWVLGRSWARIGLHAAFVLFLVSLAAHQRLVASNVAPYQKESRPEMQLVLWIRSHVPPERVVGTISPRLICLIPALTPEYTYVPNGVRSMTSTPEMLRRYYELAAAEGLSQEEVTRQIKIPGKFHPSDLLLTFVLRPNRMAEVAAGYGDFLASGRTGIEYRLDYLVLPASAGIPGPVAARYPHAAQVYRNAEFQLLQVQ